MFSLISYKCHQPPLHFSSVGQSLCCTAPGTSMGSIVGLGEAGRKGQWHDWLEPETGGQDFSCGSWAQLPASGTDVTAPL